jgi:hypothetical protein
MLMAIYGDNAKVYDLIQRKVEIKWHTQEEKRFFQKMF